MLAKRKTKNELLQEQSVSNKREIVEKITHARFRRMQNMVIPERITELDQQLKRIATRGGETHFYELLEPKPTSHTLSFFTSLQHCSCYTFQYNCKTTKRIARRWSINRKRFFSFSLNKIKSSSNPSLCMEAVKAMSKEGFLNLLKSQSDKPQKSQPSLSLENVRS